MSGKSIVAIRCFLIPKRNNSGFGKLDRRIYRRHREIRFCPAETSKIAPKAYSRKWPWLFPCFSKTQRERRCQPYPVCLNISRENGRSFLMRAAGRNTTSFAGNAKGAASRASVPPLFTAHTIYRKGEQDNDRLPETVQGAGSAELIAALRD